ncbi:MAG: toll/interleukin-1 receptor domain-containing protein [Armatimonadota bacterium]|nr:toll/interleukin-1 receptor domain-containing protein [Armatimonadota bacterium]
MTEPEESQTTARADSRKPTNEGVPLVFISHDSRDADLADAFSRLLKSVSAGTLKSFRSSDRGGTEGIQYGDEWYRRLMEKLADASDVVCLFTKRSLNRPWILFEAGVAKGKLDTPVHGIALGMSLSQVSTGPFYQFRNCQDDVEGLTGLVMQLLQRIPNTDPDEEAVALQVQAFKKQVDEILLSIDAESPEPSTKKPESSETSVAKLFEEIKVMVRDLPSNVEDRLADGAGLLRGRRSRRFDPMMMEKMIEMMSGDSRDPYLGILIMASLVRDDIPWVYELGLEAYRASKGSRKSAAREALMRFRHAIEMMTHGPFFEEFMMRSSKEGHMMMRDLDHLADRMVHRCLELEGNIKEETM